MLKNIDPVLTPDLLYGLAKAGHGDVIAVVDRNYPPYAAGIPVVHLAGVDGPAAIAAICSVTPLDTFIDQPLAAMRPVGEDSLPAVTTEVVAAASQAEGRQIIPRPVERFAFYAEAKSAALMVATGEARPYACYLLTKGVWPSFAPDATPPGAPAVGAGDPATSSGASPAGPGDPATSSGASPAGSSTDAGQDR
ncbi:MAG: hypothetical protein LBJ62_02915 [Bifidobacteriaceae bacterium]|nr:hypothetical protein [Bifidobacteriaceae bacterium]